MKPIMWRLAAASGVAVSLAFGAGPAAATRSGDSHRPQPKTVQAADQSARTGQHAESSATSEQFLPVNANVPVQILGVGKNGGNTEQSNNSTAKSNAENTSWTKQSVDQDQEAGRKHDRRGHDDHDGYDRKGHDDHDGYDRKGHDDHAYQVAEQSASTGQDADSSAKSKQLLPVNLNVPVQVLSFGHNGGDTEQSNNSTAKSNAGNVAWTQQSVDQDQRSGSGSAFQGAEQSASTEQAAQSSAKSEQILPVNVNAPVQILSFGHNGGDTEQSNNSTAQSSASNEAGTVQSIGQAQGLLGGLTG